MRWKLALVVLAFPAVIASGASAQNPNSDWSLDGGGIGRHGTGFSGTLGDPDYYSGTSRPPTLRDYRSVPSFAPGAGSLGAPEYAPVAPGYAPPFGAPLEFYTPPGRR
jgi:hypothetical protein